MSDVQGTAPGPMVPTPSMVPAPSVARPRLIERLNAIPGGGVGLVVAPAGSGKSVLVSQWVEQREHATTCTVVASLRHDDPVVFNNDLVRVVAAELPDVAANIEPLLMDGGSEVGQAFIDRLLHELEACGHEVVVVLDDAHLLENASLVRELDAMLVALPANVRLVIASRWDLGLQVARSRMAGRVTEVRMADLAFDGREGQQLLTAVAGRPVPPDALDALVERTGGWVAGLQLAGISLRSEPDAASFVDAFDGSDRMVVEYLTQEVLDRQPDDVRRFLLETSVLPWLSIELCSAVSEAGDARDLLAKITGRSLFVAPAARGRGRYCYHQLFADLLRQQLRAECDPHTEAELRRRAAGWLLANGHPADAVELLLAAGHPQAAFEIAVGLGRQHHLSGETTTLVRWLSAVDAALPEAAPEVAVNLLAAQVAADHMVEAMETYRRLQKRSDLTEGQRAASEALYACLGLQGMALEEARTAAARVIDHLAHCEDQQVSDFLGVGGRDTVEAMARFMSAFVALCSGDLEEARSTLEQAVALPAMQYSPWKVQVFGLLGLTEAWSGNLTTALRLADTAIETASTSGAPNHPSVATAYHVRALVGLERHDLAGASQALHDAEIRCQRSRRTASIDLQRVLEATLIGRTQAPGHALDHLRRPAATPIVPPLLAATETAMAVGLYLAIGDLPAARTVAGAPGWAGCPVRTRVDLCLAMGDVAAARRELDAWQPESSELVEQVERAVRAGAVLAAEGNHDAAREVVLDAVRAAEPEQLRRPFLEHRTALRLLRSVRDPDPTGFLPSLLEVAAGVAARTSGQSQLVEPLTGRELSVLELLPSRMSNRDIAVHLFVSVNTVKTHLRNIYRKLDVSTRDEAVTRAVELGLL